MAVGAKDTLFQEIIAQSGEHQVEVFIFKGSAEIQEMMVELWSPVLNKARQRGQLVSDASNEEIVEWIRNQHAVFSLRDDYSEDRQRQILANFLVPSLMRRSRNKPS
jgi:predicted polyphosphate/ATP-dependent NAD kinase